MPNIQHQLLIEATPEKIYQAITTEQDLSAWWTSPTEANGILRFAFGDGYFKEMKITTMEPFSLVKWTCTKGADEWVGTNISFELISGDKASLLHAHPEMQGQLEQQKSDTGTLLIFHHDDWKGYTPMFAECNYTWGRFLVSLKLFCETGKGRPWPNQHR
jgi:uncharacterized protein YndB with AHSA1/START domain